MMRSIGMDVHRSFAQVAICDDGQITDSFKVDMEHDAVVEFGRSLRADDEVVLEATGNTATIVRLLTPFVARVVIANPLQVKAIAHARVKTDKVDAKILAQLHAAGFLPEVWAADDETLALRRLVSERAAVVLYPTIQKSRSGSPARQPNPKIRRPSVRERWATLVGQGPSAKNRTRSS